MGTVVMIVLASMVLLPKAALEAGYFQDRKSARRTLFCWGLIAGSAMGTLAITLLFNHIG